MHRIESDRSDPGLAQELDALRALWRSLPRVERVKAADAARALSEAQAGVGRQAALLDDDAAAQLALSGLDRLSPRSRARLQFGAISAVRAVSV